MLHRAFVWLAAESPLALGGLAFAVLNIARAPGHLGRAYIALTRVTMLIAASLCLAHAADSAPPAQSIEIAVAVPLSGDLGPNGQAIWQGIQLAIDEANATGDGPP